MMERQQNKLPKENDDQANIEQTILEMTFALTGFSGSPARPTRQPNGRLERPLVPDKNLVETAQEGAGHDSNSDARTDLPNRQGRAVKVGAPPSPDELKARIKARLRRGPSRPLGALAKAEAYLHERSVALAQFSRHGKKVPDKDLLVHQLTRVVSTNNVSKTMAPKLRGGAFDLFSALQSEDAAESILDRAMVLLCISVMEGHARVAETRDLKAIGMYFRHIEKGTRLLIDLTEARASRRGAKKITVANVNVEAGGQAIVGNVETQKSRSEKEDDDEDDR
jgi:hypothetical protein